MICQIPRRNARIAMRHYKSSLASLAIKKPSIAVSEEDNSLAKVDPRLLARDDRGVDGIERGLSTSPRNGRDASGPRVRRKETRSKKVEIAGKGVSNIRGNGIAKRQASKGTRRRRHK